MRNATSRQLWSTIARLTLQPSSLALATPAASIFRLASSVSRCVATKSAITRGPRNRRGGRSPNGSWPAIARLFANQLLGGAIEIARRRPRRIGNRDRSNRDAGILAIHRRRVAGGQARCRRCRLREQLRCRGWQRRDDILRKPFRSECGGIAESKQHCTELQDTSHGTPHSQVSVITRPKRVCSRQTSPRVERD